MKKNHKKDYKLVVIITQKLNNEPSFSLQG